MKSGAGWPCTAGATVDCGTPATFVGFAGPGFIPLQTMAAITSSRPNVKAMSSGLSLKDAFFCGIVLPRRTVLLEELVFFKVLPAGAIVVLVFVALFAPSCPVLAGLEPVLLLRACCLLML